MSQIKSKDRVRDLAEVYTNEREVKAMLDLIPLKKRDDIISYRYLEPACGNGNFLIEILKRKLARVNEKYAEKPMRDFEFQHARAISTIYGIDICRENVSEAIERLYREVKSNIDLHRGSFIYSKGFFPLVRYILSKNIVLGDSINHPEQIVFNEFSPKGKTFEQRVFNFASLTDPMPMPLRVIPHENFLSIGAAFQASSGCDDELGQRSLKIFELDMTNGGNS
jgi:hypothetical protein